MASLCKRRLIGSMEEYNPKNDFDSYIERMDEFFQVNKIEPADETDLFLDLVGPSTNNILKDMLYPESANSKSFDELVNMLRKVYKPLIRRPYDERLEFDHRLQQPDETISQYLLALKLIAVSFHFNDISPTQLKHQLINGLKNEKIRARLLTERNLTLHEAKTIALQMESEIEQEESNIRAGQSERDSPNNFIDNDDMECHHIRGVGECVYCDRPGVFVPNSPLVLLELDVQQPDFTCKRMRYQPDTVNMRGNESNKEEFRPLLVDERLVYFLLDSGTNVTLCNEMSFKNLKLNKTLKKHRSKVIYCFNRAELKVLGYVTVTVQSLSWNKTHQLDLCVVEGEYPKYPMMGVNWLNEIHTNWRVYFSSQSVSEQKQARIMDELCSGVVNEYDNINYVSDELYKNYCKRYRLQMFAKERDPKKWRSIRDSQGLVPEDIRTPLANTFFGLTIQLMALLCS